MPRAGVRRFTGLLRVLWCCREADPRGILLSTARVLDLDAQNPRLLHSRKRLVFVPDSKTINGIREVPMSDRALSLLRIRCGTRQNGWVCPSKRSRAGHLTTMAGKFRQARTKAGLPKTWCSIVVAMTPALAC